MQDGNKRHFRRYTSDSKCEVRINSTTFTGKVVDYADGVGVIIKNEPQLVKGARAHIKILDYDIEFKAEIVSTVDLGYHLRTGFKRLDNLKGNLNYYRLADILIGISNSRKTGILDVITGSVLKRIFIENGNKIFAASTNRNDRLGEYLLKQGKIAHEDFDRASSLVSESGQRLGKVLIGLGYLTRSDLSLAVQYQVEEIILSLFNIDEGSFEFHEGPLPTDEEIILDMSTATLIYKGIKRINSVSMVEKMCPPLDAAFNLSQSPLHIFRSLTLEFSDKKILSYIDGINTLKALLTLSPSTKFETLKTVITLLTIGLIHIKGENEAPAKPPLEVIFGEPDESSTEEFIEKVSEEEARARLEEEIRAKVEEETRAKIADEARARAEEEARVKAEAEAKARAEEEARTESEAGDNAKAEEEAKAKTEEEAKAKAEEEARAKAEEEAKAKAEEEARAKAEEEAKAKAEAEAKAKAEEEARAKAEEEAKAKAEAEAKAKAEEEARAKAEEEARAKAEEEAKAKAEAEAKAKAEEEARAKAEAEAKAKAEEEARAKAEEEAKAKAEAEAKAKAEEEARAKAEEEAKAKAEAEAKAKAEQEAKAKAEQEAKAKAEQEAKAKAKAEARAKAEQEAKAKAEQEAKAKAEQEAKAKAKAEARAKAKAAAEAKAKAMDEDIVSAAATGSKKKWAYMSVALLVIVLLGFIVFSKYYDIKSIFSPSSDPSIEKTEQAAGKDEGIGEEPVDIHERTTPFPDFREEALEKVLGE